ncbi:MAG TPA: protein-disulfide reductase DsbD domain-containing protein [Stellaceae bacterium]|jgi:suppressor for copper-sensitivity B|nr:protein-disulfide reductase DsbD domain-containing protein [Stellaceae bacterium]
MGPRPRNHPRDDLAFGAALAHAYKPAMQRLGAALLLLVLAAFSCPSRAAADAASPWYANEQGRVRLIAATANPGEAESVGLGLQFEMAPHWKIYWRSPGDAGFPPQIDWAGSSNLGDTAIAWPAPERFSVQGLETAGYSGAVVLPITARVAQPGQPLHLKAHVSYLICSEICVPRDTDLALDLPSSGQGYGALIDQYRGQVPGDGSAEGLSLTGATLRPGAKAALDLTIAGKNPLAAPDAFIEGTNDAVFGAPAVLERAPNATTLRLPISGNTRDLVGRQLTVTLVDGPRSMTAPVTVTEGEGLVDLRTLVLMLGFALVGGLILNLMPCVLPVLSLKLLAALPRASQIEKGQSLGDTRRSFVGTAFGIVLSFLVLAAATIGAKAAGLAVGWGVQFQDPLFLIALAVLLVLFACNLWNFFEVPLPRRAAAIAERGPLGSVATGAFATLLATPCSAPFVGTALGFAFAAGPIEIGAIFFALGIGMALPYLLVASVPGLARVLPRPGRWMIYLRWVLGLLLIGTAVWLLLVLSGELGLRPALAVALLLGFAALALAVLHEPVSRWLLVGATIAGAFFVPSLSPPLPRLAVAAADGPWQAFDAAAIGGLVRDGHVVMVDVTADWCLTCKVNERLVLDRAPVSDELLKPGVVAMRADWTRPNPAIDAYLGRFGRVGIPFNVVYGPAAPGGLPLPELLTAGAVTEALAEAAGR